MNIFSDQEQTAALSLLQAYEAARDCQASAWEFALELHRLLELGGSPTLLRWLIRQGHAEHGLETTAPAAGRRTFRRVPNLRFREDTCFVLTPGGAAWVRSLNRDGSSNHHREIPEELPASVPTGVPC
jgi:hypothetical protein